MCEELKRFMELSGAKYPGIGLVTKYTAFGKPLFGRYDNVTSLECATYTNGDSELIIGVEKRQWDTTGYAIFPIASIVGSKKVSVKITKDEKEANIWQIEEKELKTDVRAMFFHNCYGKNNCHALTMTLKK